MAAFDISFPDDFLSDLLDTDFEDIAEKALTEAAPILEKSMKKSCRDVIMHDGESEMVNSIKAGKPKKTKTHAMIVSVSPSGNSTTKTVDLKGKHLGRKGPVSNVLKAVWIENGIPGRQSPRPFLQAATNDARSAVEAKMQEVYDRMTGK